MGSVNTLCQECGKVMTKTGNNQKYCASCRQIVYDRQRDEGNFRSGRNKNPGVGRGKCKTHRAKCQECGNGMDKTSPAQKYHPSCRKIVDTRISYEHNVRNGHIKNPGIGTAKPMMRNELSSNWIGGGKDWQVRTFRGKECERCGSDEGDMHLHHRDRDRSNWKKENLETLCAPCHIEEHRYDIGPEHPVIRFEA